MVVELESRIWIRVKLEANITALIPDTDEKLIRNGVPKEGDVKPVVVAPRQLPLLGLGGCAIKVLMTIDGVCRDRC